MPLGDHQRTRRPSQLQRLSPGVNRITSHTQCHMNAPNMITTVESVFPDGCVCYSCLIGTTVNFGPNRSLFLCVVSTVQADLMTLTPEVTSVRSVITACQGPGPNTSIHVQLEP